MLVKANYGFTFTLAVHNHTACGISLSENAAVKEKYNTFLALAHCKKYSAITAYNGISYCMRAMGAKGLLRKEYPLVRQLTGVAISFNTDGTSDILNAIIGRQL